MTESNAPHLFAGPPHESKGAFYAALLRLEPPAPARAKMRQTRNTQMTMLAVSPWMEPMPKSQYQWMPTLGGSPARAGKGAADKAAAAAAVAACFGAGASTERKAVFHTNSAARAAKLSSCGARRPAMLLLRMRQNCYSGTSKRSRNAHASSSSCRTIAKARQVCCAAHPDARERALTCKFLICVVYTDTKTETWTQHATQA